MDLLNPSNPFKIMLFEGPERASEGNFFVGSVVYSDMLVLMVSTVSRFQLIWALAVVLAVHFQD